MLKIEIGMKMADFPVYVESPRLKFHFDAEIGIDSRRKVVFNRSASTMRFDELLRNDDFGKKRKY
jgi:hypothetical protein